MARHTRPGRRLAFHRFALCLIHVFLAGGYLFSLVFFFLLLHSFLVSQFLFGFMGCDISSGFS